MWMFTVACIARVKWGGMCDKGGEPVAFYVKLCKDRSHIMCCLTENVPMGGAGGGKPSWNRTAMHFLYLFLEIICCDYHLMCGLHYVSSFLCVVRRSSQLSAATPVHLVWEPLRTTSADDGCEILSGSRGSHRTALPGYDLLDCTLQQGHFPHIFQYWFRMVLKCLSVIFTSSQ